MVESGKAALRDEGGVYGQDIWSEERLSEFQQKAVRGKWKEEVG